MKKKLIVYCINYGNSDDVFIAIADKNIPLKIINTYFDVENSFIFEEFITLKDFITVKKVCKNTSSKSTILHRNQKNKILREFINEIIGNDVTLIKYSLSKWNNFIRGIEEYSSENSVIIEIDHPIILKDKIIDLIIMDGINSYKKKQKEIKEKINQFKKENKKSRKKNGK